jgi:5'-methylthioadenosine phosphorylase
MAGESVARLGVIGGSGLYDFEGLEDVRRMAISTPFGSPSDEVLVGRLGEVAVAFLPRHGRGHRIPPHQLNFRANVHAMKQLGVVQLLSVGAVGSLQESIAPGHVVVPDQFLDRATSRVATFFEDGAVAHVQFGDPVCSGLAASVGEAARQAGAETVHSGGTYVNMNGPQFSTRAESNFYRSLGASVIGMTNLQEAKLAREAEMCFASLAMCTDYDCWHEGEAEVDVASILAVLHANAALAKRTVSHLAGGLPAGDCACRHSLEGAIVTDPASMAPSTRERLRVVAGRHL